MKNKRYVLALDLVDDAKLISEYEAYHKNIKPDIIKSIRDAGIEKMEIFRFSNRLMMIMEVGEGFSFEAKAEMDADNEKVQKWEQLMWKYQQAIPGAKEGEKWVVMDQIFEL